MEDIPNFSNLADAIRYVRQRMCAEREAQGLPP